MNNNDNIGYQIGKNYIAPIVFSYVKWVLDNAVSMKINTLYFLARDGYLMYRVALVISKDIKYSKIKCVYFCCSRLSLRLPSYCIISYDETLDSIFSKVYNLSFGSLLNRIKLLTDEKDFIYSELNLNNGDFILTDKDYDYFKNCFKKSKNIKELIIKKSKIEYENTVGYLKFKGMFYEENAAVVDSGWIGTTQKTLYQLLNSAGFKGKLTGFYFGLYKKPEVSDNCIYMSFYFGQAPDLLKKARFNSNIFEIVCSGNHGMTIGYKSCKNAVVPIFAEYTKYHQKDIIHKGVIENKNFVNNNDLKNIIKRFMHYPDKITAEYIGNILFSDNLSDKDLLLLAPKLNLYECLKFLFPVRLIIWKTGKSYKNIRIYWPEGSVIRSNIIFERFFILNLLCWNIFKFYLQNRSN